MGCCGGLSWAERLRGAEVIRGTPLLAVKLRVRGAWGRRDCAPGFLVPTVGLLVARCDMIGAMSREVKDARVLDDGRAGLPSASLSYVLARAAAYDTIRTDEKFNAWADSVGGVDGVCLRGSWLHGLNHADSDCDLLVVGASVDDKMRAVNAHAGSVDALCVTAGRFARLLAQADQVRVEARDRRRALFGGYRRSGH